MRASILGGVCLWVSVGCSSPIMGSDGGLADSAAIPDGAPQDAGIDAGLDAATPPPAGGWLVGFGAAGFDSASAVAASATHIAVAGSFDGAQSFLGTNVSGQRDVVVALLDTEGTLVWVRTIGALGIDEATAVALDGAGNVYVGGTFERTVDFDPGAPVNNRTAAGPGVTSDAFVLSLDATGAFRWVSTFGSDEYDGVSPSGLALDSGRGRLYAVGSIQGETDFGGGPLPLEVDASMDGFVVALGASNGAHVWSRTLHATDSAQLRGVAVVPGGDVVVVGTMSGGAVSVGTSPTIVSSSAALVARLDADDRAIWVRAYEGTGGFTRACNRVIVAATGEAYLGCKFDGAFTAGTYSMSTPGLFDGCVLRLDSGGMVDWGLTLAGTMGNESIDGLALDPGGSLWVAGTSTNGTFGGVSLPTVGDRDVFLARVAVTASEGTVSAPVAGVGTPRVDVGAGLAIGEPGRPVVVGSYGEVGLAAEGDGPLAHGGLGDGFVWRHDAP